MLSKIYLACLVPAFALTDIDIKCMANNEEHLSNDRLLGTWYIMYTFSFMGGVIPTTACTNITITKPTAEDLQLFKDEYLAPGLPYSFEDNPVLSTKGQENGMLIGNNRAKFYVLKPNDGFLNPFGYEVQAYQFLTEKFVMHTPCPLRGNRRMLLSNDRHATVEEMERVIKNTRELNILERNRFCA
ncbi:uncharacterized protein LOC114249929 [Bombyx mandarina]|uniref:Uncharacterized protein LOC114249929 n=1 Tax=Bombyx mandarina TaxID=7092 RepID=A0A6J2KBY8_BOMMA|nr:uncharacterized protein LOC114249929 [Bombyx mandarina]